MGHTWYCQCPNGPWQQKCSPPLLLKEKINIINASVLGSGYHFLESCYRTIWHKRFNTVTWSHLHRLSVHVFDCSVNNTTLMTRSWTAVVWNPCLNMQQRGRQMFPNLPIFEKKFQLKSSFCPENIAHIYQNYVHLLLAGKPVWAN